MIKRRKNLLLKVSEAAAGALPALPGPMPLDGWLKWGKVGREWVNEGGCKGTCEVRWVGVRNVLFSGVVGGRDLRSGGRRLCSGGKKIEEREVTG